VFAVVFRKTVSGILLFWGIAKSAVKGYAGS
jgi:hypothetical protein